MPYLAEVGTIRGDFSIDSPALANSEKRAIANILHASETPEEAAHEIKHWLEIWQCTHTSALVLTNKNFFCHTSHFVAVYLVSSQQSSILNVRLSKIVPRTFCLWEVVWRKCASDFINAALLVPRYPTWLNAKALFPDSRNKNITQRFIFEWCFY